MPPRGLKAGAPAKGSLCIDEVHAGPWHLPLVVGYGAASGEGGFPIGIPACVVWHDIGPLVFADAVYEHPGRSGRDDHLLLGVKLVAGQSRGRVGHFPAGGQALKSVPLANHLQGAAAVAPILVAVGPLWWRRLPLELLDPLHGREVLPPGREGQGLVLRLAAVWRPHAIRAWIGRVGVSHVPTGAAVVGIHGRRGPHGHVAAILLRHLVVVGVEGSCLRGEVTTHLWHRRSDWVRVGGPIGRAWLILLQVRRVVVVVVLLLLTVTACRLRVNSLGDKGVELSQRSRGHLREELQVLVRSTQAPNQVIKAPKSVKPIASVHICIRGTHCREIVGLRVVAGFMGRERARGPDNAGSVQIPPCVLQVKLHGSTKLALAQIQRRWHR
mmetsp:Transcript_27043/g.76193  ORF Transcript_27043/g.76193 Transcript_27043/m.76193 type:complete len:384 (+) Transcript_27043:591-1742(+)